MPASVGCGIQKQLFQFLEILNIVHMISRDGFNVHYFQNSCMMVASLALAGGNCVVRLFQCLYLYGIW